MDYRSKPFKYLFLKKYINMKHFRYKKFDIRYFVKKVLMKLDSYIVGNLSWGNIEKKKTKSGKGRFRLISKTELEKYYPNLSLTEDDEKLNIYKFTLDEMVRVCGILDYLQGIFYILVCDLDHKINNDKSKKK